MIDLESRLRALGDGESPAAPPATDLRELASRRRRHRHRQVLGAALAVTLLAAGVALTTWVLADDQPQQVTVGPPDGSTSSLDPTDPGADSRMLGGLTGVEVSVSPRDELLDGQLVDVVVTGLDRVPGASIVMCAGDVTEANALASCDFASVTNPTAGEPGQLVAAPRQVVSVSRTIRITRQSADPNVGQPYDCAVEPAGCVLAVGPIAQPVRGVLVPLTFQATTTSVPVASVSPASGLRAGQQVTFTASGLRPNATFNVTQCVVGSVGRCDEFFSERASTDAEGRLTATTKAWASMYRYDGRIDCTAEACAVALTTEGGEVVVGAPFEFAAGVAAPVPAMRLDPAGPYRDRQVVTVTGTGFRPGLNLLGQLGLCPADKDTATEERCGYDLYTAVEAPIVDANGRFTTTIRLTDTLPLTGSCRGAPGCVLGWVIPHGTSLAKVPLSFAP